MILSPAGRTKKKDPTRAAHVRAARGHGGAMADGASQAELAFARALAHNDKKVRTRAIKKLRIWLSGKNGGLNNRNRA